jgi:flagellar biosynthetic protein FliP
VIELDALAGEPMDVLVNGCLIAQGEVVVVNEKFGIRLTDIVTPSERMRRLNRGLIRCTGSIAALTAPGSRCVARADADGRAGDRPPDRSGCGQVGAARPAPGGRTLPWAPRRADRRRSRPRGRVAWLGGRRAAVRLVVLTTLDRAAARSRRALARVEPRRRQVRSTRQSSRMLRDRGERPALTDRLRLRLGSLAGSCASPCWLPGIALGAGRHRAAAAVNAQPAGGGGTTYSVPMQTLLIFTGAVVPAGGPAADDQLHPDHHRAVAAASGTGHCRRRRPTRCWSALALFLTLFVMGPTLERIHDAAYKPYTEQKISLDEALDRGAGPVARIHAEADARVRCHAVRAHWPRSTHRCAADRSADAGADSGLRRQRTEDAPSRSGFMVFIPFLIIDLIVASVLMSMGMMMLSPVLVALPFKLMLFVLADGWTPAGRLAGGELRQLRRLHEMSPEAVVTFGQPGPRTDAAWSPRPCCWWRWSPAWRSASSRPSTQINEATLSLPAQAAGDRGHAWFWSGPWMLTMLVDYIQRVIGGIADRS